MAIMYLFYICILNSRAFLRSLRELKNTIRCKKKFKKRPFHLH